MFLIISSVFFLFKPFITQLKLVIPKKTAYTSVSFATDSGLNLTLILKPLYITVINTNIIKLLNNSTKEPLNLFFCLFNTKNILVNFVSSFSYMLKFFKFDFIIVIINQLSKKRYYTLCCFTIIALNLSRLFL
jgi:hypothetical protein